MHTTREKRRRRPEGLVLGPGSRSVDTWTHVHVATGLSGFLFLVIPKARFIFHRLCRKSQLLSLFLNSSTNLVNFLSLSFSWG